MGQANCGATSNACWAPGSHLPCKVSELIQAWPAELLAKQLARPECEVAANARSRSEEESRFVGSRALAENSHRLAHRYEGEEMGGASGSTMCELSLVINRTHGKMLGVDVDYCEHGDADAMKVMAIVPGGAVEEFNERCAFPEQRMHLGDRITQVNSAVSMHDMLAECRRAQTLRLTLIRRQEYRAPLSGGRA
eukprot:TRINITY_DN27655_c0_g1_i1.p1 TRINITY_DN27655_c0_g1~~TRINITY_DN27655_c0_g1_i1.p1  ORF type:complete len:194 (+),score=32.46 TRINITY_DN27655_c0_g1_i1:88-669(+)